MARAQPALCGQKLSEPAVQGDEPWFVVLANLRGVNMPTVADFKPLLRHHRAWRRERCPEAHSHVVCPSSGHPRRQQGTGNRNTDY